MQESELAWLAGLLEGEGSFMMSRNTVNHKVYLYPKVVVTMTDKDVIQRAALLFGTGVYTVKVKTGKTQYRAQVTGTRAAEFMKQLLPFMGERRSAKINEILASYGDIESTEVRRQRSCSESQSRRWAMFGTRQGRLQS